MTRQKLFLATFGFFTLLLLAGCRPSAPAKNDATTTKTAPQAEQKAGDTTKSGKVTQIGSKFYLEQKGKEPLELDSYTVDLASHLGQTVTVTGQYSGNTLFVSAVE